MSVACVTCGKVMKSYPFTTVKTCIKCTLDENFQALPVRGILKNRDVVLAIPIDRDEHQRDMIQ